MGKQTLPILIIEDDSKYHELLTRLLGKYGFSVETVKQPQDATRLIAQGKQYPAFIVDLEFNGKPLGLDLLKKLLLDYTERNQGPAIVVSSYPQYKEQAISHGAKEFFDKKYLPENEKVFIGKVQEAYREGTQFLAHLEVREQEIYEKLKKQFLSGKVVEFVPETHDLKNPWADLKELEEANA